MNDCKGWLLMSDLDGTLLNSQKRISMENKDAIHSFVSGGGVFTIATGRTELTCRLATALLPINAPVVLYNGTAIYDLLQKRFLWTRMLKSSTFIRVLKEIVQRFPEINIQVFQGGPLLLLNPYGEIDPYIVRENQQYRYAEWDEIQTDIFKIMFRANHNVLQSIEQIILGLKKASHTAFNVFFSADYYLEIIPSGCSKGTCLSWICNYLGIPEYKTLAIGDHANDIEMLQHASYSAATENAIDTVKDIAQHIVTDCDHHAIREFLGKRFMHQGIIEYNE